MNNSYAILQRPVLCLQDYIWLIPGAALERPRFKSMLQMIEINHIREKFQIGEEAFGLYIEARQHSLHRTSGGSVVLYSTILVLCVDIQVVWKVVKQRHTD